MVKQRTQLINMIRGLLAELGVEAIDPSRHLAAAQKRIALSSTMEVGWRWVTSVTCPIEE
jgi:transposase